MDEITYPAKILGEKCGQHWLYKDYIIDIDDQAVQDKLIRMRNIYSKKNQEYMMKLYMGFVEKNPELLEIPIIYECDIYSAVMGVLSKFIIDDIKWFIQCEDLIKYNSSDHSWKFEDFVIKKTGSRIGYVMSPKTKKKFNKYLKTI